jgi:hypothetical protein
MKSLAADCGEIVKGEWCLGCACQKVHLVAFTISSSSEVTISQLARLSFAITAPALHLVAVRSLKSWLGDTHDGGSKRLSGLREYRAGAPAVCVGTGLLSCDGVVFTVPFSCRLVDATRGIKRQQEATRGNSQRSEVKAFRLLTATGSNSRQHAATRPKPLWFAKRPSARRRRQ